jgi:hypothetical protein
MNLVGKERGIDTGLHLGALRYIHKRVVLKQVNLSWVHTFVVDDVWIERKEKCINALEYNIETLQAWAGRENPPQYVTATAYRMWGQWQAQIDEMRGHQRQIKYYISAQRELDV